MEYDRILVDAKKWNKLIIFLKNLIKNENLRNSDILRLLNLPAEEIYLEYIFENYQQRRINKIFTELSDLKRRYDTQYSQVNTSISNIKSYPLLFKEFYINHKVTLLNKYKNITNILLSKNNNKLIICHTSQLNIKTFELYLRELLVKDNFKRNKYQLKEITLLRN